MIKLVEYAQSLLMQTGIPADEMDLDCLDEAISELFQRPCDRELPMTVQAVIDEIVASYGLEMNVD